jgi:hypothetical protein
MAVRRRDGALSGVSGDEDPDRQREDRPYSEGEDRLPVEA